MVGPKKQDFWQKINILKGKHCSLRIRGKNVFFYKISSPKLIFLYEFCFWKNSVDFWHRKLTLKVPFRHFLMNHNSSQDFSNSFLWECWFLGKKLAFYDPPSLKFHNRTDTNIWKYGKVPIYIAFINNNIV